MIKYEECLCDPDNHDSKLEIVGASVIVTYTCRECGNEIYDTNNSLDDIS